MTETSASRPGNGAQDLGRLLDALPSLVALVDADERTCYVNRASADWLGVRPEQAVGRPVRDLVGGQRYATIRHHVRAALAGHPQAFEATVRRADGTVGHTLTQYVPFGDGGPTGFAVLVTDITRQVQAELAQAAGRHRLEHLLEANQEAVGAADDLLQELYAIGLHLDRARRLPDRGLQGADRVADALATTMDRLRSSIRLLLSAAEAGREDGTGGGGPVSGSPRVTPRDVRPGPGGLVALPGPGRSGEAGGDPAGRDRKRGVGA